MADTRDEPLVLVTGATGAVGTHVVAHLERRGARVRALTRTPESADLPSGVEVVAGELSDLEAMRAALDGVDGLFLLSAVVPEELTGTLLTLDLAREAGVRALVYLSVIHADRFTEPPHFAAKAAAERMIAEQALSATTLRPGVYMQGDAVFRDRIVDGGLYPHALGGRGVLAVDVRDLGEIGAAAMLERLAGPGPVETLDVVAPQTLTGDDIAGIWREALGREVVYGGDDLDGIERFLRGVMPAWMARDMRLMYRCFQHDGMVAAPGTDDRLVALLGRPMRSYRDFALEAATAWAS